MALQSDQAELPELTLQAIEWLVRLRSDDMDEAETHAFADWLSEDIHAMPKPLPMRKTCSKI